QNFSVTQSGVGFSPIRINCGGPSLVDANGQTWSGDSTGNHAETNSAINNTNTQALYQTEAWSTGTLQYQFSVPNGSVNVRLHFAEFYLNSRGLRVFNIVVNGQTVQSYFDIL